MKSYSHLDSHTGGEPTRLILDGGPDLGGGSMAERLALLRRDHDALRRAVINEPRGSDVLVGALLCAPVDPACAAGVIFFNNVGYLGMCGHGTIGLAASLAYLDRIGPGLHKIETPVGVVEATLHAGDGPYPNRVTLRNVRSYRHARAARVDVPGIGVVHGDIAWGGNWFFLMHEHGQPVDMAHLDALTDYAARVRAALGAQGVTGAGGAEIDHIELFAPTPTADGKSFVLCPGRAYDRSPCGTGTSAKLACLAADGLLQPGQIWRQESVVGSRFEGSVEPAAEGGVIPTITGEAWVMGAGRLLADPRDPFALGIV